MISCVLILIVPCLVNSKLTNRSKGERLSEPKKEETQERKKKKRIRGSRTCY
jgi:hypothetical protein